MFKVYGDYSLNEEYKICELIVYLPVYLALI